jgi:molybdopterin molybdotransferase
VATPFERQDSAMVRVLAAADALVLRPPHAPALPAGAVVPVIRLDLLGL